MRWGEDIFKRNCTVGGSWRDFLVTNTPDNVALGISRGEAPGYCPVVFDMDMDERTIRPCECSGTRNSCDKCWEHIMMPIMKATKSFLVDLFGFKSVLFIFSGKRGFHCYILDPKVWNWTSEQRAALLHRIPTPIKFDEAITVDLGHLVKMPLFPHQATKRISCPIGDLDGFRPSHAPEYSKVSKEQMEEWSQQICFSLILT
jgi:DNA primase catalytic subunit